ncbi:MAG TPA: DoxX family protein [Desulfotignum sp.]|nr:DoxX family protein [Desulfotignum sp.]
MESFVVKILGSKNIYTAVRFILGGIFLYSGVLKLSDLAAFAELIGAWGMIPRQLNGLAAVVIAFTEAAAGAGLILDIRASLGTITVLLVMFMAVLTYGISMGYDIDCGCFGESDPEAQAFHSLRQALVRDLFMVGTAGYLYLWRRQKNHTPVAWNQLFTHFIQKRRHFS